MPLNCKAIEVGYKKLSDINLEKKYDQHGLEIRKHYSCFHIIKIFTYHVIHTYHCEHVIALRLYNHFKLFYTFKTLGMV